LFGGADLLLFAGGDVGADSFRMALHSLGGDLDTSQQVELFAALIKAGFCSYQGRHTA